MTTRQKQWQLWLLGYYDGTIDGAWGVLSKQATSDLQEAYGLTVDGIFGSQTEELTRDIITQLQKALTDGTMAIDGLAGMETSTAVADWQRDHNKPVTGRADVDTLHMILAVSADKNPTSENWWDSVKHFDRSEFRCKCGGKYCNGYPVEPSEKLLKVLDEIRERTGLPVYINSGIRCRQHNINEGGAADSRHLYGDAADIRCPGMTPRQLFNIACEIVGNSGGVGIYSWGIHVDTRGYNARWVG